MASVLTDVAKQTRGKAVIGLVMVSDKELVRTFGISKIPATFLVRDAEIAESFVGTASKEKIAKLLE